METNLRTFYTLIVTQAFSQIGSRMTGLALSIYLVHETGSVTPLALTALFGFLPQVVIGGFAGALADRWDRRYVMVIADAGQAVGTVILMLTFFSGTFQVGILYAVTLLQSVFGIFQSPAFSASITLLIPDRLRDRANAIQQLTGPAAGLVAPAFAGGLYAAVGVTGVIAFDLITFVTAVIVVMFIHIPRPAQSEVGRALQGSMLRQSFDGFRFLFKWRTLFLVNLQLALVNFLLSASAILFTPYLLARTGSEAIMGALLSVFDAGAIAGGVLMSVWGGTRPRIHTILPGIILCGLFLVGIGVSQSAAALAITLFLNMFPIPMINAAVMSLMQTKVPPDVQGRVFAAMSQMVLVLMPLAYLLIGPLADQVFEPAVGKPGWEQVAPLVGSSAGSGYGLIMVIAGILLALTTLLVYAIPRVRRLEAELPDYVPESVSDAEAGTVEVAAA